MQNTLPTRFDDEDQDAFDDVDALFNQLERFEPPVDMVERIMDAVSKLPSLQHLPQTSSDQDSLIAHYNDR